MESEGGETVVELFLTHVPSLNVLLFKRMISIQEGSTQQNC